MTRSIAIAALTILVLAVSASAASADHLRGCGRVPHTKTGRIHAGTHTSCALARETYRVLADKTVRRGAPYRGTVHVHSSVTGKTYKLDCVYYRRGHTVYDCGGSPDGSAGEGIWVQVTAGRRTS